MDPLTFIMSTKLPKRTVLYGDQKNIKYPLLNYKGKYQCIDCVYYSDPKQCTLVDGQIDPSKWCLLWLGIPRFTKTEVGEPTNLNPLTWLKGMMKK